MAKTAKRYTGDIGEEIAYKWLKEKGFRILERNYWKPWGEIDMVTEKAQILRFIEVKTVSCESLNHISCEPVRPEENMHPAKLKRLHRAVQTYLLDHKVSESREWQIDLACVYLDFSTKKAKIELFENIIL